MRGAHAGPGGGLPELAVESFSDDGRRVYLEIGGVDTRPAGCRSTIAEHSGIEWETGRNLISNGPELAGFRPGLADLDGSLVVPTCFVELAARVDGGERPAEHRTVEALRDDRSRRRGPSWAWVMMIASSLSLRPQARRCRGNEATPGEPSISGKVTPRSTRMSRSCPGRP